jgi:hypothetical protein
MFKLIFLLSALAVAVNSQSWYTNFTNNYEY